MEKTTWKETCKKINGFLARFVHLVLDSLERRYQKTKHHYVCIYTSAMDTLFNNKAVAGRGGSYVKNSIRSVMMPFEKSKHKSAKKLLQHAEKQCLDLSLNPYRVLHSSIHNELRSQKLKKLNVAASYKKAHKQSGKVFVDVEGAARASLYQFTKYESEEPVLDSLNPSTHRDPHIWQRDVDVGSIVEI